MTGFLALEDGTVFRGESVAADGSAFGEAVFTTAMTGYQEVVTDPSYAERRAGRNRGAHTRARS
jgi:carbamoyl-phosphate synthase small subunit